MVVEARQLARGRRNGEGPKSDGKGDEGKLKRRSDDTKDRNKTNENIRRRSQ